MAHVWHTSLSSKEIDLKRTFTTITADCQVKFCFTFRAMNKRGQIVLKCINGDREGFYTKLKGVHYCQQ